SAPVAIHPDGKGASAVVYLSRRQWEKAVPDPLKAPIAAYLEQAAFDFHVGKTAVLRLHDPIGSWQRIVLTGLDGTGNEVERWRLAAAAAMRTAVQEHLTSVDLLPPPQPECWGPVVLGARFGSFQCTGYKTASKRHPVEIALILPDTAEALSIVQEANAVADGIEFARRLQYAAPNDKAPYTLARRIQALFSPGVVEILDEPALKELGTGGILGVGQGSVHPPCVLVVRSPALQKKGELPELLALVGKGVTFDSGGYSLKPGNKMVNMKYDMSGAAAVLGAIWALHRIKSPAPVLAVIPLAENMIGGGAQRPGDVVSMLAGLTVEITNTDAEGRMILADALTLAVNKGATHLIDVATLTYAGVIGLGRGYAALMGNDANWQEQVKAAAQQAGERIWALPLDHDSYGQAMQSDIADLRNAADEVGGALTAGYFLSRFVHERSWAHIDMGLQGWDLAPSPFGQSGAKGGMTATLYHLVQQFTKNRAQSSQ
ncbi:MAG: leucyl aminopeptidase family protein, partial [Firmicutes bacterium]|nr:leucyl aminopeptidase family protein [Bacillota bacterium]